MSNPIAKLGPLIGRSGASSFVPFLAFFLSGASSLIFQTIWTRMMHHVFGSTSVAISSVLTVFMGGLGLGAWIFGKYADRIKHPLITYAIAEIGVGVCGLIIPLLVSQQGWLSDVNAAMRESFGGQSPAFNIVRFLCVVPILIVPTTLMGSTLPLLARHFIATEQASGSVSSRVGMLYAVNTFGAVGGTFLAGFMLMPTVGLSITNYAAVSINFLLAALIFVFRGPLLAATGWKKGQKLEFLPTPNAPRDAKPEAPKVDAPNVDAPKPDADTAVALREAPFKEPAAEPEERARGVQAPDDGGTIPPIARKLAFFAFAASGAAALCYEVVWSRALAMTIGSSIYSFTLILMTFLIGIASGSAATSSFIGQNRRPLIGVGITAGGMALIANVAMGVEHGIVPFFLLTVGGIGLIGSLGAIAALRARNAALFETDLVTGDLKKLDGDSTMLGTCLVSAAVMAIAAGVPAIVQSRIVVGAAIAVAGIAVIGTLHGISRRAVEAAPRAKRESVAAMWSGIALAVPVIGCIAGVWFANGPIARTALVLVIAVSLMLALLATMPRDNTTPWALGMLIVPAAMSAVNASIFEGYLPKIGASVVFAICLFLGLLLTLRRVHVLLLAIVQLLIAGATFVSYLWQDEIPLAFARLVTTIDQDSLPDHVGTVQFFMFLTVALCTLPATLGMGAMFPLTIRVWTSGGRNVGRDVGVVYTGNTVGSIIGAWLPGFVLMPALGLERTLHVGIWLNMGLGLILLIATAAESPDKDKEKQKEKERLAAGKKPIAPRPRSPSDVPLWQAATVYVLAPLVPALGAALYLGTKSPESVLRWDLSKMTLGVFRVSLARDVLNPETWGEPDLVYYHDGLTTTVSVERWGRHYALKNNGKVDASNGDDMPTQIMVAGYPMVMHPRGPRNLDVAVVGLGSGVTVGTALQFPVRSVDVIELERSIPEASQFFSDVNHLHYGLSEFPYVQMPRLTVINDDGRNYLASTRKSYDIIISEPSNPWITGVSDLFTVDHFAIAKQRLRPGGIYCQWVQLYEMSPENIKTIYRTFASQFRYVVTFAAEDLSSDTVLLGSDSPLPLDLERVRRAYELPGIATELERAYIHSPFDIFARVLLASRDEMFAYAQLEYRRRGEEWVVDPESSNGEACSPGSCIRRPAPLNTDDNALIEFAAPHDLIGFQRYEGYLANIYSASWPYGRLSPHVRGFGEGVQGARNYAELAMALIAHGRKREASEFITRSRRAGQVRETLVAVEVLTMLLSDDNEPRVSIEPPMPGPQMDARTAEILSTGFDDVRRAVDQGAYAAALVAMEEIPTPIRMHSGPGMRLLYGYLLYKGAEGNGQQYRAAIEVLEDLVREEEDYVERHPEAYYFLARAHDSDFNFDKSLRNMRIYVETRLAGEQGTQDALPEPDGTAPPISDEPGEAPKTEHADRT